MTQTHTHTYTHTHTHTHCTTPLDEGSALAEVSTQHTTLTGDRHPLLPTGFEPAIPASEWPQTLALDRASTLDMQQKLTVICFSVTFRLRSKEAPFFMGIKSTTGTPPTAPTPSKRVRVPEGSSIRSRSAGLLLQPGASIRFSLAWRRHLVNVKVKSFLWTYWMCGQRR